MSGSITNLLIFPSRHCHLLLFPISVHDTLSHRLLRWKSQESMTSSPWPSSPVGPTCPFSNPRLPPPPTPSSSSLSPPVGACKALPTSPLGVDCCSLQSIPHLAASGPINHPLPKAQECSHCSQLPQYEPGSPTLPCLIECHLPLHPCTPAVPEYVHALTRLGACLIPSPFVIRNNPLI